MLIRPARPDDAAVLHQFILDLAADEDFPGPVPAQARNVAAALFGPHAIAEAVLVEIDAEPAGFALFYPTYSTVLGRPGLHLEDLYVRPDHRGNGVGRALLAHLAELVVERGGGRLEWWVLRTNEPALRFYASLHARDLDELTVQRLDGTALHRVAAGRPGPQVPV
jgi:GNAT superfamily N-acetyltransferase